MRSNTDIDIVSEIIQPETESEIARRLLESKNVETPKSSDSVLEQVKKAISSNQVSTPVSIEDAIKRQERIKVLKDKIDQTDDLINTISDTLSAHTKNFNVQVDISNNPQAKKAVKKIFKKSLSYIDKNMYLYATKRLHDLQTDQITNEFVKE